MPTIKELVLVPTIVNIHNKKAPPGVYIEFKREGDIVTEFHTHFHGGNKHIQVNNDRSFLFNSPDTDWIVITDLEKFLNEGKVFIKHNEQLRRGVGSQEARNYMAEASEVRGNKSITNTILKEEKTLPVTTTTVIGQRKPAIVIK